MLRVAAHSVRRLHARRDKHCLSAVPRPDKASEIRHQASGDGGCGVRPRQTPARNGARPSVPSVGAGFPGPRFTARRDKHCLSAASRMYM